MINFIRKNALACALLLIGFVCSLVLCGIRAGLEADNTLFCAVMTREDAQSLSFVPDGLRLFDGGETLDGAVLLVEDENQYSYLPMATAEYEPGNSVRCFKLIEEYAARFAVLGYDGAQEIENILYRAVTERNIRVVWLTPFTDSRTGQTITDGAVYEQVLEALDRRTDAHGLRLTDGEFSIFPEYEPNSWLITGVLLGVIGGALLLISLIFTSRKVRNILFILFCCGLAGLILMLEPRVSAVSLAAACLFPCLSVCCAAAGLAHVPTAVLKEKRAFCLTILPAFAIAFVGGLFVAALQSSGDYLLAVENFRGVKLSQAVPLCFALFAVYRYLYGRDGLKDILFGKKVLFIILIVAVLAVAVLFLLRTGDGVLSVGVLEQRFRNFLENVLLTRPRTKEFLVAWPCLAIAFALASAGAKRWLWPFTIIPAIGFSSVVNTFCHSRAPVWLSGVRSVIGLVIGLVLGLAVLCVIELLRRSKARGSGEI